MLNDMLATLDAAAAELTEEITALQARLTDRRAELKRIQKAKAALDPTIAEARVPKDPSGFTAEAEKLLAQGPMTKKQISSKIGGHRSRTAYALGRLERDGRIVATGRMIDRSPEYTLAS